MQKITDEILRAWVDGELSPERSAEIKMLVAIDESLAAQADRFEASKLPYTAAMNLDIPPVPDELRAQVEEWTEIANNPKPVAVGTDATNKPFVLQRTYRMALSAAAVLLFTIFVLGAMVFKPDTDSPTNWVQAVVNYQNFYVAETIEHVIGKPQVAAQKLAAMQKRYPDFPGTPPDLEALGYEYKRMQHLDFNNQPVLQMVFYKEGKRPLAICLMPGEEEGREGFARHRLLNSYAWHSGELRAVVVAEEDAAQLKVIADLVGS